MMREAASAEYHIGTVCYPSPARERVRNFQFCRFRLSAVVRGGERSWMHWWSSRDRIVRDAGSSRLDRGLGTSAGVEGHDLRGAVAQHAEVNDGAPAKRLAQVKDQAGVVERHAIQVGEQVACPQAERFQRRRVGAGVEPESGHAALFEVRVDAQLGIEKVRMAPAERELLLPRSLTKRLVNHARSDDVTESYAADWTVEQLREPAQRIANRIDELMG